MRKFSRLAINIVLNLLVAIIVLYITTKLNTNVENKNLYTKTLIAFLTSGVVMLLSILIKGYLDVIFYFAIYGLISVSIMSCMVYYEIFHKIEPFVLPTIIITSALMLVVILSELYLRMKMKKMAQGCLNGEPLDTYVRSPWSLLDEKKKKTLCMLYFDIPDLGKVASEIKPNTIIKMLNYTFTKSIDVAKKYNATIIRRNEDSALMVVEPNERIEKGIRMLEPENKCAYNAVLCGLELKQIMDDMKEQIDSSPIKRLKGRVAIATDSGVIIKNIRLGRLEFSVFTNAMSKIEELLKISDGEDLIIDSSTYDLCPDSFSVRHLPKKAYSVIGLSGY